MNYCRYCGSQLVDGECQCAAFQESIGNVSAPPKKPWLMPFHRIRFTSFSRFVSSIRDMCGISEPGSGRTDPYEYNVPIVPDCIQPEENEIVVKQYNLAILRTRLKFMKAEGRLMVTNRRLLFRAGGTSLTGNILQEHQFNLDEIGGVEIHKDYKFSLLSFFGTLLLSIFVFFMMKEHITPSGNFGLVAAAILLGIGGLVPTFVLYQRFWLKLLGCFLSHIALSAIVASPMGNKFWGSIQVISNIILLANLIIVCFVPNLVVKIKTKGASGAIVIGSQKSLLRRKTGDDYSGFVEVLPWEDTIMAINELGTLIDDLQKHGDYAVEKWTQQ